MTTVVGLYSLRKGNLGDCYATYSLECSAVSVSLSPTSRHLLVGLTSRTSRIISLSPMDRQLMAQVRSAQSPCNQFQNFHVAGVQDKSAQLRWRERQTHTQARYQPGGLRSHELELHQVNILRLRKHTNIIDFIFSRWIPVPGQGIVFATNTGLLKILR